ncbi:MAG: AAA family ATPase, partial [Planctomycetales bacterium]|nr:AAA family ATPase [Planctomycetales bacterium]
MYEAYWGLQRKPFENTSDAQFYYPSETHQAALLKLRYVVENGRQAAALTGASGLGKSVIVHSLLRMLPDEIAVRVHVVFPQMPADQLLAYIASELTGEKSSRELPTIEDSVRRLQYALQDNVRAGRRSVVVVDESHLINDMKAFDTLRLLLNFET